MQIAIVGVLVGVIVRVVGGSRRFFWANWTAGQHSLTNLVVRHRRRTREIGEGKHHASDYTEPAQARSHCHLRTATHGYARSLRTAVRSCGLKGGIDQSCAANYCLLLATGQPRPSSGPRPSPLAQDSGVAFGEPDRLSVLSVGSSYPVPRAQEPVALRMSQFHALRYTPSGDQGIRLLY